jgi:asparagine synthase (glutamine-hydrolysing)
MPDQAQGHVRFRSVDSKDQSLLLARDRIGKKPLHYCLTGDGLIFASEIKALLQHPSVSRDLDFKALSKYLSYDMFPLPTRSFARLKSWNPATT